MYNRYLIYVNSFQFPDVVQELELLEFGLSNCEDHMPLVLNMESQIIQQELITDDTNLPGILSLKYSLIDIGSNPFIFCK